VEGELAALGYDIVATARTPEQALQLTGNLRPDAVVVAVDSLERASALLAIRMLSHRHTCAVVVLVEQLDRATQAQLKTVTPHAVAPWPIPGEILDVVIHAALEGAAQRVQARLARLDAGSRPGLAAGELEVFLRIAQSRAMRHATSFAAGAVALVCDATGDRPAADVVNRAAERLRSELRQHDVVRSRADGTLVFIAEDVGPDELEPLGDRILHALSELPGTPGADRAAWPAIGLAPWSAHAQDMSAVLSAAGHAMAQAKATGRACWRVARRTQDGASTPMHEGPLDAEGPQDHDTSVRPLVLLQRIIGWVSLAVLFWIAANYMGFGAADWLGEQTHRLLSLLTSLR
jgi:hypothetical protein